MTAYIITDEMLQIWRKGCVNLSNPHTNDDICKKCEYRGKGMREKCCDFGDTDMEKIFRSYLYNPQAERDKVLDKFLKEIRVEMSPPFEYLDWDSIEAVYIKLRQEGKDDKGNLSRIEFIQGVNHP